MDKYSLLLFNPSQHIGMFMHRVVIQNDMHALILWRLPPNFFQKSMKFLVPVLLAGSANHPTRRNIKGSKQRPGTMLFIVTNNGAAAAFPKGQARLRAIQHLD